MQVGDIVVRKSYGRDITFKIIDINYDKNGISCTLKGINLRIIADAPLDDLEEAPSKISGKDEIFNEKVNESIRKILMNRNNRSGMYRGGKVQGLRNSDVTDVSVTKKELTFGRPGTILHVDGDAEYLDVCMKTYKQLSLQAVGKVITEVEQPNKILDLVKSVRPDIVVITGHDNMTKNAKDYMNLNNYKNSKYFVEAVSALRNYEANYDDLVIFAGACQSCYEAILDAGANFASSPDRVLIHCLDPVFICEKIAYSSVEKIVQIQDVISGTITGIKGIGGLQTRGKYREGYPKSQYIK